MKIWYHLVLVFVIAFLANLPTISGLDSDFQAYALIGYRIFKGQILYLDIFSHKPPLFSLLLGLASLIDKGIFPFLFLHIFIMASCSVIIFYTFFLFSKKIARTSRYPILSSYLGMAIYFLHTVVEHMSYGNLNGGITQLQGTLTLVSFYMCYRIIDIGRSRYFFGAGFFTSLVLLTRLSPTPVGLSILTFIYVFFVSKKRSEVGKVKVILLYLGGAVVPAVILLNPLYVSIPGLYEHLIIFNRLYSIRGETSLFLRFRELYDYFIHFFNHTSGSIYVYLIALSFLFYLNRGRPFKNKLLFGIFTYFVLEVVTVMLQGQGSKQYPFFPTFIPYALFVTVMLSSYYFSQKSLVEKSLRSLPLIYVGAMLLINVYENQVPLKKIIAWKGEKKLKRSIFYEKKKKGISLFTFDFYAMLYIETSTLPPNSIPFNFFERMHWSWVGSNMRLMETSKKKLLGLPPSFITISKRRLDKAKKGEDKDSLFIKALFEKYRFVDSFKTVYSTDLMLFKLKNSPKM